jgi:hypothetical protein
VNSWIVDPLPPGPYRHPCVMLASLDSDIKRCGQPSGEHTIMDYAICDECWEDVTRVS